MKKKYKNNKNTILISAISLLLSAPIYSIAADYQKSKTTTASYKRPAGNFLRYKEDWSTLKGVDKNDLLAGDQIKYVELSKSGKIWASFGGHLRGRYESHGNFAFGAPASDEDEFILYRGKVHGDFHFGERFRLFAEFKHAESTPRDLPGGNRNIDIDQGEIQQFFVDYKIPLSGQKRSLSFRFGRQEYGFGRSRLVSPLPWANALRQWDGINVNYKTANLDITAFYSQFVPVKQTQENRPDADNQFFGVYATQKLSNGKGFDYYWLGIDRKNRTFNGTTGDESRDTFGVRHWGKISKTLSYEGEVALQTGSVGSADISAFMLASELTYKPANVKLNPKITFGFDYASGDNKAGGDVNTFNQLFPLGHAYFGFIDIVGRQNIVDYSSSITINPFKKAGLRLGAHYFQRADDADGLYNAGAGLVRAGSESASKSIGTELDLTFSYKLTKKVGLAFGYSKLFAGDYLKDTGSGDDINFAYAQVLYTF
jgi:hypothetical protein